MGIYCKNKHSVLYRRVVFIPTFSTRITADVYWFRKEAFLPAIAWTTVIYTG